MQKRKLIIGTYDTALTGLWTLTGWSFSPAQQITNYIEVPGRVDGELDASTALTDGDPRYSSRTLTATFESSEGTRLERETRINTMVNWLDGWRLDIILPDDLTHYITGRVHVEKLYNDPAHASVQVTAVCDPWRYNIAETVVSLTATATAQTVELLNNGRRAVTPLVTITGTSVNLGFGTASWALGAGTYALPDLFLTPGGAVLTYSGTGSAVLTYREAVL